MARPFKFDTPEDCIHHHVALYYEEYAKNPDIRFDLTRHIAMSDEVNKKYLKELSRNRDFDYDKYCDAFIDCINFLTKIYTKRSDGAVASDRKKQLLGRLKKHTE